MNLSFYPKQINMYRDTNLTTGLSHFIQLSASHLKIIAIAVVIMALLAELTYLCWRSYRWKVNTPKELEQSPTDVKNSLPSQMPQFNKIAEIKDTEKPMLLEADLQGKSPSKQTEHPQSILETPMIVETHQPSLTKPEIDPMPQTIIPPVPNINAVALYWELAQQTKAVPSLPYTYGICHFTDILCPTDTRVQVPGSSDQYYLHANNVELDGFKFIASQYPTPVQKSLFWRAAQKACLVLDLTNDKDMKKGLFAYYPVVGNKENYSGVSVDNSLSVDNGVSVECKSKQNYKGIEFPLYQYSIIDEGHEKSTEPNPETDLDPFQIARLHFERWNDHYGITEDELDQLIAVMSYHQKDVEDPVMVHCRAGVGRTGTIIVARVLQHLINQKKVTPSNLKENLSRLILEGRQQRGEAFVQTPEQILALWKWGWRAAQRGPMEAKTLVMEESV